VDWSDTFTGVAQIRVRAVNIGCEGAWSEALIIQIQQGPAAFQVTGGGAWCELTGNGSPVGLDGSEAGIQYTLHLNGQATPTVVPGTGAALAFGNQPAAGTYTVTGSIAPGGCTNTMNGNVVVSVDPQEPAIAGDVTGPAHVYSGATPVSDYITSGAQYATAYDWQVIPAVAGAFSGSGTTGVIAWNQAYAGQAEIIVSGINSCGAGLPSDSYWVLVDIGVGIDDEKSGLRVKLWPNPAEEVVYILHSLSNTANVQVADITGKRVVISESIRPGTVSPINIRLLAKGLYMVTISTENEQCIRKLVRQ
jgi:hypothetical protein